MEHSPEVMAQNTLELLRTTSFTEEDNTSSEIKALIREHLRWESGKGLASIGARQATCTKANGRTIFHMGVVGKTQQRANCLKESSLKDGSKEREHLGSLMDPRMKGSSKTICSTVMGPTLGLMVAATKASGTTIR